MGCSFSYAKANFPTEYEDLSNLSEIDLYSKEKTNYRNKLMSIQDNYFQKLVISCHEESSSIIDSSIEVIVVIKPSGEPLFVVSNNDTKASRCLLDKMLLHPYFKHNYHQFFFKFFVKEDNKKENINTDSFKTGIWQSGKVFKLLEVTKNGSIYSCSRAKNSDDVLVAIGNIDEKDVVSWKGYYTKLNNNIISLNKFAPDKIPLDEEIKFENSTLTIIRMNIVNDYHKVTQKNLPSTCYLPW